MITLHLNAAGLPTSWILAAVYGSSYGIAVNSAKTWSKEVGSPNFVIEIDDEDKPKTVRKELFWVKGDDLYVQPIRETIIQTPRFPVTIDKKIIDLVSQEITYSLIDVGYYVSDSEWRRRRPSDVLMQERFQEFFAAEKKAKEAGEELPFDPRYTFMMPMPEDYVLPYDLKDEKTVPVGDSPTLPKELASHPDQHAVYRLLNTGWNFEETLVHLGPIQID